MLPPKYKFSLQSLNERRDSFFYKVAYWRITAIFRISKNKRNFN